jgi:hypothetical protein
VVAIATPRQAFPAGSAAAEDTPNQPARIIDGSGAGGRSSKLRFVIWHLRVWLVIAPSRPTVIAATRKLSGPAIEDHKLKMRLPRGVTVTQRPLEALFLVRIQAG